MNIDPPAEFDPSEALTLFAEPGSERYGLSDRTFFYLIVTCKGIESFAEPAFSIDSVFGPPGHTASGCWIEFIIKSHAFWIDVSPMGFATDIWSTTGMRLTLRHGRACSFPLAESRGSGSFSITPISFA